MQIIDCEQNSPEWYAARLGKITASCFDNVLANGKAGQPSKTRQSYMYQIAAEILSGQTQDSYTNEYMEWGKTTEPQAALMYEEMENIETKKIGFVIMNDRVGASPDRLVGDKGLLEIKCPKSTTQLAYFLSNEFPVEYKAQVQGQLWVTGREWTDFVSFDPRLNSKASFFKVRVFRDDIYINKIKEGVEIFLAELDALLAKL